MRIWTCPSAGCETIYDRRARLLFHLETTHNLTVDDATFNALFKAENVPTGPIPSIKAARARQPTSTNRITDKSQVRRRRRSSARPGPSNPARLPPPHQARPQARLSLQPPTHGMGRKRRARVPDGHGDDEVEVQEAEDDFEVIEVVDLRTPSPSPTPGPSISSASAELAQPAQTHSSTHPRAQSIVTSAPAISVPPTRAQGYAAALSPDSTPASTPVRALPRFSSHKDDQDDVIDMVDMVAIEAQAQVDAGTASSKTAGGALGKAKKALGEKPSPAGLAYIQSLITPQSQKSMADLVRGAGKQRKRKRSKKDKTAQPAQTTKAVSRQGCGAKGQKEKTRQDTTYSRPAMQDDRQMRETKKGKKRVKMAKEVTEIRNPADWADSRESTFNSDAEATMAFKLAIPARQAALGSVRPVDSQAAPAFIAPSTNKSVYAQPANAPPPPSPSSIDPASKLRIPSIQGSSTQTDGRSTAGLAASSKPHPSLPPSHRRQTQTAATARAPLIKLPKADDIAGKSRNTYPITALSKQTGGRPSAPPPPLPSSSTSSKSPLAIASQPKLPAFALKASSTPTAVLPRGPSIRADPTVIREANPPVTPPPASYPDVFLSPLPAPVALANKKPRTYPLPPAPGPLSPLSPDLVRVQFQTPPPAFAPSTPSTLSSSPSSGSIASTSTTTTSTSSGYAKSKKPDRVPTWVYMSPSRFPRPNMKLPHTPPITPEKGRVATTKAVQHRSPLATKEADAIDSVKADGDFESDTDDEMTVDSSESDGEMRNGMKGSLGQQGMRHETDNSDIADEDEADEADWASEAGEGDGLDHDDELDDEDGLTDEDGVDEGDHTDCGDEMREGHGLKGECELSGCGDHGSDGGGEDSSDTETGVDGHRPSHLRARDNLESEGDLEYDASDEIRTGREEAGEMDGADWDAHGGSGSGDDEGSEEGTEDDVEAVMDHDGKDEVYMRHENVYKGHYNDEYSDDGDESTDSTNSDGETDESDITHISETDYEDDDLGQNVYELLDTLRATHDSSSFALHKASI